MLPGAPFDSGKDDSLFSYEYEIMHEAGPSICVTENVWVGGRVCVRGGVGVGVCARMRINYREQEYF